MRRGLGTVVLVVAVLSVSGTAHGAPTWLPPFEPLPSSTWVAQSAMNAGGESLFVDVALVAPGQRAIRASTRPPGGTVSAPTPFPEGGSATLSEFAFPALALGNGGHAVVAWVDGLGAFYALRSPAGVWTASTPVPGAANVTDVVAGIDAEGRATLAWAENTHRSPTVPATNDASVEVVRIGPDGSASGAQTLATLEGAPRLLSVREAQVAQAGSATVVYNATALGLGPSTVAFRDGPIAAFGSEATLSMALSDASTAIGDSGRAVVTQASGSTIALRVRQPGHALGPAQDIDAGGMVAKALVGVAADGEITLAWGTRSDSDPRVLACRASSTGCLGEPQRLSSPGSSNAMSGMDVNANGAALVAWTTGAEPGRVHAALRVGGASSFGPEQELAPAPANGASVALDSAGNGVASFNSGTESISFKAAGLDAAGPHIHEVRLPATAERGTPVTLAAAASDVWGPVSLAWTLGGSSAVGNPVSHVFSTAGSSPVTLTATDAVGNSTTDSGAIEVVDRIGPRVGRLRATRKRFRVGAQATPVAAVRRPGRGTTIRYRSSEAGTATFVVERAARGRMLGRACVKPKRSDRRRRACSRYVQPKRVARTAREGPNALAFSGRIGRKALKPGRYRVTLRIRDAVGNVSSPEALTLTIVRR